MNEQGFDNQIEQYELRSSDFLSESDDFMITKANHKKTGLKVAIKVIQKNEIYRSPQDIPEIVFSSIMKMLGHQKTHIV